ncbi:MAG TPA: class I SAM-dependent methyltransferase [Rhodothermales bacterium]|nr:class I SAM-dependent methyltransferase [Rhodothermales bacterium]
MDLSDALTLLRPAFPASPVGGRWVDFGAGTGLFTQALAMLLGPETTILAIDRDVHALATLRKKPPASPHAASIQPLVADMQDLTALDNATDQPLDGVLFANSLHFIEAAIPLLEDVAQRLRPSGRVVIVEYDRSGSSQWVPYPISQDRLELFAEQLPFASPRFVSTLPSAFGGQMYCAVLDKQSAP